MGLKKDIAWTIEVMPSGNVLITGCLQISGAVKVPMGDYVIDSSKYAKETITEEIKEKCFEYGHYDREKNEYYLQGYRDALNGFDPFD